MPTVKGAYDVCAAVQARLIDRIDGLTTGNCLITVQSVDILSLNRLYVEVYPNGSTFWASDGGLLGRKLALGVALRRVVKLDRVTGLIRASKEIQQTADAAVEVLHLWLPEPRITAEPIVIQSEGRPYHSQGARSLFVIEQTYQVIMGEPVPEEE